MIDVLLMIFQKMGDLISIVLNLDLMLSDGVYIKVYWIFFLLFAVNMFIVVSRYYLKGVPDGNRQ